MSGLSLELDAVNLGQGFPDFGWPEDVLNKAADAVRHGWNQYPSMSGLPELREAVAVHYARFQRLDLKPEEVTVTSGATEAQIGRAHVWTPVTNAHHVCRILLVNKNKVQNLHTFT